MTDDHDPKQDTPTDPTDLISQLFTPLVTEALDNLDELADPTPTPRYVLIVHPDDLDTDQLRKLTADNPDVEIESTAGAIRDRASLIDTRPDGGDVLQRFRFGRGGR